MATSTERRTSSAIFDRKRIPPSHRDAVVARVNIERLFGSQRAVKTVEDFTEFEQRAAYFDGDPVIATKKGVNLLEPAATFMTWLNSRNYLDFPPAPKLDIFGKLDPAKATAAELRGQNVFFGKGNARGVRQFYLLHG
jgi:hypothetical protein